MTPHETLGRHSGFCAVGLALQLIGDMLHVGEATPIAAQIED